MGRGELESWDSIPSIWNKLGDRKTGVFESWITGSQIVNLLTSADPR